MNIQETVSTFGSKAAFSVDTCAYTGTGTRVPVPMIREGIRIKVVVQSGAGLGAQFADQAYVERN